MYQLGRSIDGEGQPLGDLPPHPLVIIDLKEVPDRGLKAAADHVAQQRGQGEHCLFYSPDEDLQSPRWDLLSSARRLRGVNKQVGFLLNAFGLVYDPVYGEEYFANAMGTALTAVIQKQGLEQLTYNRLVDLVGEVVSSKKKRIPNHLKETEVVVTSWRDARGLYDKIQRLRLLDKLATDTANPPDDCLNLQTVIEKGDVLYVHLGSTFMPNESWDIGRMLVFSLLKELVEQIWMGTGGIGDRRRCFLFMDEFQRLGAKNVVQRFEDARSSGLSFVLSHQTPKSLSKKDGELFEMVFQNCALRQAFSLEDLQLLDMLERLSGIKSLYLRNQSKAIGSSQSLAHSDSTTHGADETHSYRFDLAGLGDGSGVSYRHSTSRGSGETRTMATTETNSFGMQETKVPRFDSESARLCNASFPSSVIYVRDGGRGSLTPTEAIPRTVYNTFIGPEETRALPELGLKIRPREEPTDPAVEQPPEMPEKVVAKRKPAKTKKPHRTDLMRKQIAAAAQQLTGQLPQDRTLVFFARSRSIDTAAIIAKCEELGIELADGKDSVLSMADLETLAVAFAD